MKATILIVDDNVSMREILAATLRATYHAREAGTIAETKAQMEDGEVDVVLLDLHLQARVQDYAGFEILTWIRHELIRPVSVIMCTVEENITTVVEAVKRGADDYLSKNCSDEELLITISKAIEIVKLKSNLSNISSLESKVDRLEKLATELTHENEGLKAKLEQFLDKSKNRTTRLDLEAYKAICGAIAHSLKGEFVHIGHSAKNLRILAGSLTDVKDECDFVERSIEYSQILLRRLLDYLDTGKPRLESINIVELFRKTELLARPRLQSNIQLTIALDHSAEEQTVFANFEQLLGVLFELIDNAVSVLRNKGGSLELHCQETHNHEIAISVKDSGPGIPDNVKRYLFKKQVVSKNGLGIGLFFSHKIISAMGGKLSFRTSSNTGTTFTVLLPAIANK